MFYSQITKFKKKLKVLLKSKKTFLFPKKNSILIFDKNGADIIEEFILSHKNYNILHARYENINLMVILFSLFRIGKYKEYIYFNTYIELTKPKYILTYIDTSPRLLIIKKNFKNIKYIFFQNGNKQSRWLNIFNNNIKLDNNIDYYFTHQSDLTLFKKKYFSGNIITAGSIKNNSFKKCEYFDNVNKIQWVSQFRTGLNDITNIKNNYEYFILKVIKEYCDLHKIDIEILCATKNNLDEVKFYNSILNNLKFLNNQNYNSYKALSEDSIVIGIDSCFLKESFSRGFRTAFISVRNDHNLRITQKMHYDESYNFGWPREFKTDQTFWTSNFSKQTINNILKFLTQINFEDWANIQKSYSSIMMHDYGNNIIKENLKFLLKND